MSRIRNHSRRGVAIVMALVVLAIAGMYISEQTRLILMRRKQANEHAFLLQAQTLTVAGYQRAKLQRQLNASYAGETWSTNMPSRFREPSMWEIEIKPIDAEKPRPREWQITAKLMVHGTQHMLSQAIYTESVE